ncbi:LysR family transcriptional regulator [Amphritea pacifica]|uniref:LysR family transcriptional regulator n=1 Tax=Amphritea pacifica TaxID=2811233 RepID=A0ABS2W8L8_9GAMM|nr:LysR family transcriptional regulator [Amphritea pacifica]MBN0988028.1 LysR family transcriptional regulator [Amphritea pacifica]MBN1005676.1 LysR family transcriptional regulator [Amphritea pacifica]
MKVTLEQWRMLKAVVEHGGFAHAAEVVHKSQSSIHHAIQKMELMLEVKLLEVKGRKAHLTDAGRLLLQRAEHLLESAANIDSLAASLNAGVEPEISIAVDQTFPPEYIGTVLEQFSQEYPNTRIQLYETVLSGAAEALNRGQVDLAIAGSGVSHFMAEPLFSVDFIAVASPDHPIFKHYSKNRPLQIDDLVHYRQLVTRDSALDKSVDSGWLKADERWTVSNISTSVEMICRGMGFAWIPVTRISRLLNQGALLPVPLEMGRCRKMTLQLYYARHDRMGPGIKRVAELLHRCCDADVSNFSNIKC